jgi:hypothetical protein
VVAGDYYPELYSIENSEEPMAIFDHFPRLMGVATSRERGED